MRKLKKIILYIFLVLIFIVGGIGYYFYNLLSGSAYEQKEPLILKIYPYTTEESLKINLKESSWNLAGYELAAKVLKLKFPLKTGRYELPSGSSNMNLVRILRSGLQKPVRVSFNSCRTIEEVAEILGEQLMIGKDGLIDLFSNTALIDSLGFDAYTFPAFFLPDTYEFYWNVSPHIFITRLLKEYHRFWNDERLQRALDLELTAQQVSTLASIVEGESAQPEEWPIIAGLYLNRLRKGMLLQSDPTVKYAVGDPGLKRILYKHLEVESPYNTYLHKGLPPGPIGIPSKQVINAVLNPSSHNYLYMCAKEDFSGRHNFASTLTEHRWNARKYQAALDRKEIK